MAAHVRFDLSKRKGCSFKDGTPIAEFTLRETNGADEEVAGQLAGARGDLGLHVTDEQIRRSIVAVNGAGVGQPYLEYDGWSSRARQFAFHAWRSINGVETEEAKDFVSSGAVIEAPSPPDAK